MNKKYLFLITFIIAITSFSCQKKTTDKEAAKKLELIFQEGDPPSLHPHRNISHIRCVSLNKLLFEGLTRINEDQKAMLAGAESVEVSEDKMCYTFTLRDCMWSNKNQITAFDYLKAWQDAIMPNSICLRPDLFYVIKNAKEVREGQKNISEFGVSAIDKKTLKIELAYPCTTFLELLANSIFTPLGNPNKEPEAFNGPFIVTKWNKTKNLILKKNPLYWDKKSIHLNKIEINFVTDVSTGFYLFKAGKIDWLGHPISAISVEDEETLRQSNILEERLSTMIFWIHINTELFQFKSKNIRKALSYAIDRRKINGYILNGADPISFLPSTMAPFEYDFEHDPDRAKEYFERGLNELKISLDEFPEIEISYFTYPKMKMLAQYLERTWSKVLNIRSHLIEKDWNAFRNAQEKGEFDIGGCYETVLFPDPMDLLERLEKKNGWDKKDYERILLSMKKSLNEEEKMPFFKKSLEILNEEMPLLVLSNKIQIFAHNPHLKGYYFDYTNGVDFSRAFFENN